MSIQETVSKFIFGLSGGLAKNELALERNRFSDLLPYVACRAPKSEKGLNEAEISKYDYGYLLKDNSIGYIFECSPLIYAGDAFKSLVTLLKLPLPPKTVVQTMIYADSHIEDILDGYKSLRYNNPNLNEIYKEQVEQYCEFFRKAAHDGLWQLSGTPMRTFRLYISLKIPIKSDIAKDSDRFLDEVETYNDIVNDFKTMLDGQSLAPRRVHPDNLLSLLYRIFNPSSEVINKRWNTDIPLHKQIINAESDIERTSNSIKIGSVYAKCITPKQFPKQIEPTTINNMIGYFGRGAQSMDDDMNQIKSPFILTSSFIYENLRTYLETRAGQVNIQQAAGQFAQGILLRKQEMFDMKVQLEQGEIYLRALMQLWVFDTDEKRLSEKVNRVVTMWRGLNIEAQKERSFILPKLFVSALPLGLYGNDYKDLQRDFILPASTAAYLMTVQAGYIGMGKPYMLFMDRRAQLTSIDIFNTGGNKNFLLTGGSGNGKSFFLNYLINSYRAADAKVRVLDIGESYKKTAMMFGGQFIKFAGADIVLNFFEGIGDIAEGTDTDKQEDYAAKLAMLTGIIATMALSRTKETVSEMQMALIEQAIDTVIKKYKSAATIDLIAEYLDNLPSEGAKYLESASAGHFLSIALHKYATKGEYGRFFHGKSNVSFSNDLVVVELDGVPDDLRKVIVLAFASMIEDEVYNGDRERKSIIIIDEAWQTLSENPAVSKFVEGLYRKIRKYNGSVGIATQSLTDTGKDGTLRNIGNVVRQQSNIKFILPDEGLIQAKDEGLVNFSQFEWHYLVSKIPSKSLPRYSEIFVKSDKSGGIVRLTTDLFTYFVCSSDATDNTFLTFWSKKYRAENLEMPHAESMKRAILKAVETCNELGGLGAFKEYLDVKFKTEKSL